MKNLNNIAVGRIEKGEMTELLPCAKCHVAFVRLI